MGRATVATAHVPNIAALTSQLAALPFGDSSYYLLQRSDAITDWKKGVPDVLEIEAYTRGRLFGSDGEVRWQEVGDGYSLLWLSERDLPEGFVALGEWRTSAPQDVFLLGGGDTAPWRDTRIPRELNYPMEWCQFPRVRVIHYKEINSQSVRFTRYTDFADK